MEGPGVVFLDASYLIALFSERDSHHERAHKIDAKLKGTALCTTELVLIELLDYAAGGGEHLRQRMARAVDALRRHPRATVLALAETPFEEAFAEFSRYADKGWSLTDCASFLVMRRKGIAVAAAFDGHFEQAQFVIAG